MHELLNLPTVIHTIFNNNDCVTINDVYNFLNQGQEYLRRVPNLGVTRLKTIVDVMASHGFEPRAHCLTYEEGLKAALRFVSYPKSYTEEDRLKLKEKLEVTIASKGIRKRRQQGKD